jgi:hypothetical protein
MFTFLPGDRRVPEQSQCRSIGIGISISTSFSPVRAATS